MRTTHFAQLITLSSVLIASFSASAADGKNQDSKSLQKVICSADDKVYAVDDKAAKYVFSAPSGSAIKVFQGWQKSELTVTYADGKVIKWIKVKLSSPTAEQGEGVGYVMDSNIMSIEDCKDLQASDDKESYDDDELGSNKEDTEGQVGANQNGLTAETCCTFPLYKKSRGDYKSGMQMFGWRRPGNRKHGGVDLYGGTKDPFRSITEGKVIRDVYSFYGGTYAMDVRHAGGFVVRYGEMTGKRVLKPGVGTKIQKGELLGYIGTIKKLSPMLHFELYKGTRSGSRLSIKGYNKYNRRADVIDPTSFVSKWEKDTFSKNAAPVTTAPTAEAK